MTKITIDRDACKGCGLCTSACPKGIMQLDKTMINSKGYYVVHCIDNDACISCAMCARMCPDVCITVER